MDCPVFIACSHFPPHKNKYFISISSSFSKLDQSELRIGLIFCLKTPFIAQFWWYAAIFQPSFTKIHIKFVCTRIECISAFDSLFLFFQEKISNLLVQFSFKCPVYWTPIYKICSYWNPTQHTRHRLDIDLHHQHSTYRRCSCWSDLYQKEKRYCIKAVSGTDQNRHLDIFEMAVAFFCAYAKYKKGGR